MEMILELVREKKINEGSALTAIFLAKAGPQTMEQLVLVFGTSVRTMQRYLKQLISICLVEKFGFKYRLTTDLSPDRLNSINQSFKDQDQTNLADQDQAAKIDAVLDKFGLFSVRDSVCRAIKTVTEDTGIVYDDRILESILTRVEQQRTRKPIKSIVAYVVTAIKNTWSQAELESRPVEKPAIVEPQLVEQQSAEAPRPEADRTCLERWYDVLDKLSVSASKATIQIFKDIIPVKQVGNQLVLSVRNSWGAAMLEKYAGTIRALTDFSCVIES